MGSTMNKAVPWNIKGVGFDAREVAHMAARRAGLPVGEWLNSVITEQAHALGVAPDHFSADERLDALVARLAGLAESVASDETRSPNRSRAGRMRASATRASGADPMSQITHDDDGVSASVDERDGPSRRGGRGSAVSSEDWSPASTRNRTGEPGSPKRTPSRGEWDDDILLDQALDLVGKRASMAGDQISQERQRLTVAALAKEVDRLNRVEPEPEADRQTGSEREKAASKRGTSPRPMRDAVGSVAERIEEIQNRISHRDADLANRPIVSALSRLEERFETLLRRNADGARDAARVETTFRELDNRLREITHRLDRNEGGLPARSISDVERIDGNLASILSRLEASPERERSRSAGLDIGAGLRGGDSAESHSRSGRKINRDAVADIAQRQADLDAFEDHRTALLRGTSYPSIGQAQRGADAREQRAVASRLSRDEAGPPDGDDFGSFAGLQDAFSRLAERLEERLDKAAQARAAQTQTEAPSGDIGLLKSGIAELADRLDTISRQNEAERAAAKPNVEVENLRLDIAALQHGLLELAPQSAITTLEKAVRDLGGQLDMSRLDGVSDAILAPIERLRLDVRQAVEANDPRASAENVQRQLQVIADKVASIEGQVLDPAAFSEMHDHTEEVRDLLRTAAGHFQAAERIESEVAKLGTRIDRLTETPPRSAVRDLELGVNEIRTMLVRFSPDVVLQDVSHKLDRFATRIDSIEEQMTVPAAMFDDFSRRIDEANASLAERLSKATPQPVDLGPIETMIGGLSGKIDGLRHSSTDMQALGGLVRGLAAQIEEARLPSADAKILDTLETQVGRLADRLDRSDASLEAITSVERLVGDLFRQLDDTRTATIDAAENAARNAAQETLRAALVNPAIAGEEASARATRVVEQVGQEISEFRKSQQASEKRVHSTLLALNDTLERMVDRLVKDAQVLRSGEGASDRQAPTTLLNAIAEQPSGPGADDGAAKTGLPGPLPRTGLDLEEPVQPAELKRPTAKTAAPAIEIGRPSMGEPMPDVSPLIAAARRAAQAAQSSAMSANKETIPNGRGATIQRQPATARGWRAFFKKRRRPILLSLAGVVLLLGALQILRWSQVDHARVASDQDTATPASTDVLAQAPIADTPTAALAPTPVPTPVPATTVAPPPGDMADTTIEKVSPDKTAPDKTVPAKAVPALALVPPSDPAPKSLNASLRDLADRGDPAAQYEVGVRLAEGRGVTRDLKAASGWFEKAANQGLAPAQYRIGSLYEKGLGVTTDSVVAVSWYEKAAAQGNVRAMHNLAVMAAEGGGGKPDYAKAANWFTKAAQHGVRDSQYNLAILYARGLGVATDLGQSYQWFAIAAAQGDADAGRKRDEVAAKLDAAQLATAKGAVDGFKPEPAVHAANEVAAPPGGWDVASPAKAIPGVAMPPKVSSM